jgi:hypothetical protein
MKLIDMRTETYNDIDGDSESAPPPYPPGLRLVLEDDALDRLGLDDIAVGDIVSLAARAKIVAYSESAGDDDTVTCRLELQIIALGVDGDQAAMRARRDDDRLDELGGNGYAGTA